MIKLTLKMLVVLLVVAAAGCGREEEPGIASPESGVETELSDEALIDIMAHSTYLSMELQEDYDADPEAAVAEFERNMEEVANNHGVSLEDLQAEVYERQWNSIMSDPELQQRFQERAQELQEQ